MDHNAIFMPPTVRQNNFLRATESTVQFIYTILQFSEFFWLWNKTLYMIIFLGKAITQKVAKEKLKNYGKIL